MAGLDPNTPFFQQPLHRQALGVVGAGFRPFWDPFVREKHPRIANALRWGTAAITGAPLAFGAYNAYHYPERAAEGISDELGITDPAAREEVASRVRAHTPAIFWHSLTGRNDALADINRRVFAEVAPQDVYHGMYRFRRDMPGVALPADVLSLASPFGLARNAFSYGMESPIPPDVRGATQRAIQAQIPSVQQDPSQVTASPLLPLYHDIVSGQHAAPAFTRAVNQQMINASEEGRWYRYPPGTPQHDFANWLYWNRPSEEEQARFLRNPNAENLPRIQNPDYGAVGDIRRRLGLR
jgi:hypothetical protein